MVVALQNGSSRKIPSPMEAMEMAPPCVSPPCGLAAVTLEEAVALARASACITHDHPEGVKGAEAVSAAIFLAKTCKTKEEIRKHISEHYYNLDFTLDSIRSSYHFDGSCQGSVPQAMVAFLESNSFEDAIRNVISIGGDCDTTGAITGSIAWVYYAIQTGEFPGWVYDQFDPVMLEIKAKVITYLPKEFVDIADEFHEVCWRRAGTYSRVGGCTSILNIDEWEKYLTDWGKSTIQQTGESVSPVTEEIRDAMTRFCNKYIVLMEVLYKDKELNQWCRNYSAYTKNTQHCELEKTIYDIFMKEAYALGFMPKILSQKASSAYSMEVAINGTEADILHGICMEIHSDYGYNGALISHAIASGNLYRLMHTFLSLGQQPQYTLEYAMAAKSTSGNCVPGACSVRYDSFEEKWHMRIQLDAQRLWFLSVFIRNDGNLEKYALDKEAANDSHYEFVEVQKIRDRLYVPGDEKKYFHEILIRYIREQSGNALLTQIEPYITAQFHY